MSAVGKGTQHQQLQQDLQNELTTANQLLRLISIELHQIKQFTDPNGPFDANIRQNASLLTSLASLQKINLENLPPVERKLIDMSHHTNQNNSYENHDSFRTTFDMDDSQ